ncbi:hypothetical protein ACQJBY_018037 [Aegilops geniculata]
MASSKVCKERFDAAVTYLGAIGIQRETVSPVLTNLLELYDHNWEFIEADDFRVLTDAIFDEPDPKEEQQMQANKMKNLDSDHCKKKLKIKHHSRKPTSKVRFNEKTELAEAPLPQEAGKLCPQTVCATGNTLQLSSSRVPVEEINMENEVLKDTLTDEDSSALSLQGQELPTFETPLAVMCPLVQDSRHRRAYNDAHNKSIIELDYTYSEPRESGMLQIVPAMDFLSKPSVPNQAGSSCMPPNNSMIHGGICPSSATAGEQSSSSNMLVIAKPKGPAHDVNDITKGEEHVRNPIINEGGNGILPPPFHYIPRNITFQNAYVSLSLARIGDDNCCSDCFGDCLAEPIPCACAAETGGDFAYTRDGLLKEEFLNSCLSVLPKFYCKICSRERVKIVNSESPNAKVNPCKGHPIRKFIKECWSKCGCTRNCGNRVVQRGISRHLQVSLTPGEKGWGVRAAEELPRGAFICEYVGEILTNNELYERNNQMASKGKHTYPTLLDADWVTEDVLEDDHALCLDGTFYGNVARFINHRCSDANLIVIPVEIETPDHHYYHPAIFTTKQIKPFEELTWDYGLDFDDVNHPVEAFKCCCGSEFCQDKRNI